MEKEKVEFRNEYQELRHRNALDLNLIHIDKDIYRLPKNWCAYPEQEINVDLSASGKEQLQLCKNTQLKVVALCVNL